MGANRKFDEVRLLDSRKMGANRKFKIRKKIRNPKCQKTKITKNRVDLWIDSADSRLLDSRVDSQCESKILRDKSKIALDSKADSKSDLGNFSPLNPSRESYLHFAPLCVSSR